MEFPTDMTSEGLAVLMETAVGRSAFAMYVLLCEFAATLPDAILGSDYQGNDTGPALASLAGVLYDDRGPYTASRLARKLPATQKVIDDALALLSSPQIGWLEMVDLDQLLRESPGQPPGDLRETSGDSPSRAHPKAAAAAPAAAGGVGDATELIGRLRIPSRQRASFADWPASALIAAWYEIRQDISVKKPHLVLCKRLEDGPAEQPPLTADAVYAAWNSKLIKSIAGHTIKGLKRSGTSLIINEELELHSGQFGEVDYA